MKDMYEFIKREFSAMFPNPKGGTFLGLVGRIILSGKSRITKQLYYEDYNINVLRERKVGV